MTSRGNSDRGPKDPFRFGLEHMTTSEGHFGLKSVGRMRIARRPPGRAGPAAG
jgi:hypothetical protein